MCAAEPANRALACGVRNRVASTVAGSPARSPNRAIRTRVAGPAQHRAEHVAEQLVEATDQRPEDTRARPCRPVPGRRRSRRASGPSRPRVPSSSGCARSISGWRQTRPCSASGSEERNGDETPNGCTAEQTSCSRPGTVSSAVRVPPPIVSSPSSTVTERPACASATAAASPLGPEPTTTASRVRAFGVPAACSAEEPAGRRRTSWGDHAGGAAEVTCTGTSWSVGWRLTRSLTSTYPRSISPVAASTSR